MTIIQTKHKIKKNVVYISKLDTFHQLQQNNDSSSFVSHLKPKHGGIEFSRIW